MMIHLCVLSSFISLCYGQNAVLSYQDDCHKVGDTLTIIAVYTGTGTPQPMAWTYSGSSLTIDTDTCLPFGGVPQNFPNESRLSYDCVTTDSTLPPDTYQLKVSRLQDNELNETWGATFTPPGGIAPGAVQLAIPRNCDATTTKISTTSTTTSTSTTTHASTTTTPLKTTTPASTTSTITTTSMRTPVTTSMPPTTSTTLPSISTSSTKTSNEGLSDEIIIVIVIVPVGVIAIVGTIIFFCLFYRLRRGKRKPASRERHKQGRHYKEKMRPVQQYQQQPYILYGRGHTSQSNHKETKRSQSLHDDRYNWYDGYHWGSQVKQNPLYKGDRNLGRLYYNESLPRYDDYWSGYTKGHVYPSHTSGYQYRPDYHGDSRGHGNRQHSSYPVYSTQQEYFDPSYSYLEY